MILVYRPELDNPPMAPECSISFSFTGEGALMDSVTISSGVTRDFPEDVWEKIKDYAVVKGLLSRGALRIDIDAEETATIETAVADTLVDLALGDAMSLIEASFDLEQLRRWDAKDQRVRIKNTIAKRIEAIEAGRG
jgi:hypothetical protein